MNSTSMLSHQPISHHRAGLSNDGFSRPIDRSKKSATAEVVKPSSDANNSNSCSNSVSTADTTPSEHSACHKHEETPMVMTATEEKDFVNAGPAGVVPTTIHVDAVKDNSSVEHHHDESESSSVSEDRPSDFLGGSRTLYQKTPSAKRFGEDHSTELISEVPSGASRTRCDDYLGDGPSSYNPRRSARRAGNSWIKN